MPEYKNQIIKKITLKIYVFLIHKKNNFDFLKKLYKLINYIVNTANNEVDIIKKINDEIYLYTFEKAKINEIEILTELQLFFIKEILKNGKK